MRMDEQNYQIVLSPDLGISPEELARAWNGMAQAQQLLLCLAPFTSVIWLDMLDRYTEQLRQQPALAALPFERWPNVLREVQNWGLLNADPTMPGFLRLQPTFSDFLRSRLQEPAQAEVKQAVEHAFREHYQRLGFSLDS